MYNLLLENNACTYYLTACIDYWSHMSCAMDYIYCGYIEYSDRLFIKHTRQVSYRIGVEYMQDQSESKSLNEPFSHWLLLHGKKQWTCIWSSNYGRVYNPHWQLSISLKLIATEYVNMESFCELCIILRVAVEVYGVSDNSYV